MTNHRNGNGQWVRVRMLELLDSLTLTRRVMLIYCSSEAASPSRGTRENCFLSVLRDVSAVSE
jgi:hypothetical protein